MHLSLGSAPAFAARRAVLRSLSRSAAPAPAVRRPAVRTFASAVDAVKEKIASEKVIVFSKSYCPYCVSVKALMTSVSVKATIIELDEVGARTARQPGCVAWLTLALQRGAPRCRPRFRS